MVVTKEVRRGEIEQGDLALLRNVPVGIISIKDVGDNFEVITHEFIDDKRGYRNVHCTHYDLREFEFLEHVCDIANHDDELQVKKLCDYVAKFHADFMSTYRKETRDEAKKWLEKMNLLAMEAKRKEVHEKQEEDIFKPKKKFHKKGRK